MSRQTLMVARVLARSSDREGSAVYGVSKIALSIDSAVMLRTQTASAFDVWKALLSFMKCNICDEIGVGAESGAEPHMNDLGAHAAADLEDFSHCRAFLGAVNGGLVRNADGIHQRAEELVKGASMGYAGLRNDDERENPVKWFLHSLTGWSRTGRIRRCKRGAQHLGTGVETDCKYMSGGCVICHQNFGERQRHSGSHWPIKGKSHSCSSRMQDQAEGNPVMQTATARSLDEELATPAAHFGSPPVR